jgi:hypothetical protein
MSAEPSALTIEFVSGARRKKRRTPIQSIHHDINRAGFRSAASPKHRVGAFRGNAAQIGGDPDIRA